MADVEQAPLPGLPLAAVEESVDVPSVDGEGGQEEGVGDSPARLLSREAANYRTRLREVEAQRVDVTARLEAAQRRQAEDAAGDVLARPEGLWVAGVALGDLLDEAGMVDPARVREAAEGAAATYGFAAPRGRGVVAREGTGAGAVVGPKGVGGMAAVIRGD